MAVYTRVGEDELRAFLANYPVSDLERFEGITAGVENTNYRIVTRDASYILTLYEKRVDEADLPFFIGLMEHLAHRGVTCPTPLKDRSGASVSRLAGRPAALVTFMPGTATLAPQPEHCRQAGAAMARLHLAAADFALTRANALGPVAWAPLFERFSDRADEISAGLQARIADELAATVGAWPSALPGGVIHADMFPDNVFFRAPDSAEVSGIIDFYFACNDWLAYDLAVAINAWCFDGAGTFLTEHSEALVAGYQSVRPLEADEVAALPRLCRGAALRFLLTRAHDWLNTAADAQVRPHDPIEFLRRVEAHAAVTTPDVYGVFSS